MACARGASLKKVENNVDLSSDIVCTSALRCHAVFAKRGNRV